MFDRDSPTKLDIDVLSAIGGVEVDVQKYPSIHKWMSTMKSYSSSEMKRLVRALLKQDGLCLTFRFLFDAAEYIL